MRKSGPAAFIAAATAPPPPASRSEPKPVAHPPPEAMPPSRLTAPPAGAGAVMGAEPGSGPVWLKKSSMALSDYVLFEDADAGASRDIPASPPPMPAPPSTSETNSRSWL